MDRTEITGKRKACEDLESIEWTDWLEEGEGTIGQKNTCQHTKEERVSHLIGWATNPHQLYVSNSQSKRLMHGKLGVSPYDPFMHHPTPPPKPSHLVLLNACAQKKISQSTPISRSHAPKVISRIKCKEWDIKEPSSSSSSSSMDETSNDSEDTEYEGDDDCLRNFKPKAKVMIHTPVAQIRPVRAPSIRVQDKFDPKSIYKTMTADALVALGIVVQESLTAMLLPLAKKHVSRCRKLDLDAVKESGLELEPMRDPFVQWTLSPQEAIVNMSQIDSIESYLPSALPPTRTMHLETDAHQTAQYYVNEWTKRHGLDPLFVSKNMDLFRSFIPTAPEKTVEPLDDHSDAIQSFMNNPEHTRVWVQQILYPPK